MTARKHLLGNKHAALPMLPARFEMGGERWRIVPGTNAALAVNLHGDIVGRRYTVLARRPHPGGYAIVSYVQDSKRRNMYVHRAVASAWLTNPEGRRYVNHKDGNKQNNGIHNLEWCSARMNTAHAIQEGLIWNLPTKGQRGFQSSQEAN